MNLPDLHHIAAHMRAIDRSEIYGMRWNDDPVSVAEETYSAVMACGTAEIFHHHGVAAAVCGAVQKHPGCWSAFAYGTEDWGRIARKLSIYARTRLAPYLFERANRIECATRYDHVTAHRWLEWLGAERESTLRCFGKDGADYFNYAWTRE